MSLEQSCIVICDGTEVALQPLPQHHIFTTLRVSSHKAVLWSWHEERLIRDARLVGSVWERSRKKYIAKVASELQDGAIRITCTSKEWWIHAWKAQIEEEKPLRTRWVDWSHQAPLPASSKHGYRQAAQRCTRELNVDVLLWKDRRGYALEASFGNLFFIGHGCIYTPSADGHILNGVGRRSLIWAAQQMGLCVREESILHTQKGWWMTSALRGIQSLDISTDEPVIYELRKLVHKFWAQNILE